MIASMMWSVVRSEKTRAWSSSETFLSAVTTDGTMQRALYVFIDSYSYQAELDDSRHTYHLHVTMCAAAHMVTCSIIKPQFSKWDALIFLLNRQICCNGLHNT